MKTYKNKVCDLENQVSSLTEKLNGITISSS